MVYFLLVLSMFLYCFFYSISVLPEHLTKMLKNNSYKTCGNIRKISFVFLLIFFIIQILVVFILNSKNEVFFNSWGWIISAIIGVVIAIPAGLIMRAATKAAKGESYSPDKNNKMYGGIYQIIRHPQMIGDILYWFVIVFLLNSKTLFYINLLWIPLNLVIAFIEEYDLKERFGDEYTNYIKRTNMVIPIKYLLSKKST